MKATGIVRRVDELGRIVLPIELRRTLDISERDALEIYVEGSSVILKKYRPSCIFCDGVKDVSVFRGKNVWREVFEGASRGQLTAGKAPETIPALFYC